MPERAVLTSLIGPAAPLLSVNADSGAALGDGSMFLPRSWHKSTPFLLDDQRIGPMNPVAYNTDINFEIPKQATLMGEMHLHATYPPAVIGGAPGQSAYVDWLGYAQIALFQQLFGSNKLYDTIDYDYYIRMRTTMNLETYQRERLTNLGDTSTAQRNLALVNGHEMITDLMLPFSCVDETKMMEKAYPLICLSQKTRFTLRLDLLANLLQIAAGQTVTVAPPTLELYITSINTTADEGNALLSMSQQSDGITYMMHQRIRQNSDIIQIANATGGTPVINLTSLTKPLKVLYWALVPSHLRDNTNRNDKFFFNPQPAPIPAGMGPYQPIRSWSIESGGNIIQRTIDRTYNKITQFGLRHPSPVGDEIFHQSYSLNPVCLNESHGFLDWTNLNNPRLSITFPSTTGLDTDIPATAQTLNLIVNALDYNWWYLKSGNITRAFN